MVYENKTVFVTGGASGIGKAVCGVFSGYGANVVIADYNVEGGRKVAEDIIAKGGKATAVKVDVSNRESVEAAVAAAVAEYGSIEMLVNCAGIIVASKLENLEESGWDKVVNVNLKGSFLVGQAIANEMKKNRYGKMVFIASAASKDAEFANGVYCVTKAGVDMLTHVFALELAEYGINVNSVNPSYVDTDIFKAVCNDRGPLEGMTPDEYRKELFKTVPMGRAAEPVEIAELCALLCDDKIGFLTGENVLIAGGKVMRM